MGNPGGLPEGFTLCCDDCCPTVPAGAKGPLPSRPANDATCGTKAGTAGCFCLLFYHDSDGHTRHLALPDSKGNVTLKAGKVYEYRCVMPVLAPGAGPFTSLCSDPTFRKDPADPNGSAQLIVCPKQCTGNDCRLFHSSGGKWQRVKADDDATGKKFSKTSHGELKIDPDDLDELRKKMMFHCFCQ